MGDPQASFEQVMSVLGHDGALAGDRLAPDVHLISIGDHFDYDGDDAARAGVRVLRWLASHDPAQVTILLGNHDAARVMELIGLSDADFAAAQARARAAAGGADFATRFPTLPTPDIATRDYASYTTEQRALVIELLLAGRFRLATHVEARGRARARHPRRRHRARARVARRPRRGGTDRGRARRAVGGGGRSRARRLDARRARAAVARAAARRRHDGRGGWRAPLPSAGGDAGREAGRAAPLRPARAAARARADRASAYTGHHKCRHALGDWLDDAARARKRGGIRTLAFDGAHVTYRLGVHVAPGAGTLVLVDGEMRHCADAYELLEVT